MEQYIDFNSIEDRFSKNSYILKSCLIIHHETSILLVNLSSTAKGRDRMDVEKSLRKTLGSVNKNLSAFQAIKYIIIANSIWTSENGFLEKDQSPHRAALQDKYNALLDKALTTSDRILW